MNEQLSARRAYPSDVSDEEWSLVAPYLTLIDPDAPQRVYPLRDLFDGLRWMTRTGAQWRYIPNDFPPWHAVYQQSSRWMAAGVFEKLVHDLRVLLRICSDRAPQPSAAIFDGRVMQSTPESGARAGDDGHKRKKGSKVHIAVDTLGLLLALKVTAANEQERARSPRWRLTFRQRRTRACNWRSSTRDTPESRRKTTRRSMEFIWRS